MKLIYLLFDIHLPDLVTVIMLPLIGALLGAIGWIVKKFVDAVLEQFKTNTQDHLQILNRLERGDKELDKIPDIETDVDTLRTKVACHATKIGHHDKDIDEIKKDLRSGPKLC